MLRVLSFLMMAVVTSAIGIAAEAQEWLVVPAEHGTFALQSNFLPDPVVVPVQAGGADDPATALGAVGCTGLVSAQAPLVRLDYTAGTLPLNLFVNAIADTTLMVHAPDDQWRCNDDANGFNPMIEFESPPSGQYDIWVGIWGEVGQAPAELVISERHPQILACEQVGNTISGETGQIAFVMCPAACTHRPIWGTGVYSEDSTICTAAVHAGILGDQRGGVFNVTIAPGMDSYPSTAAFGVTSGEWARWGRSYTLDAGSELEPNP